MVVIMVRIKKQSLHYAGHYTVFFLTLSHTTTPITPGGHREGRRNFIEHTEYQDPQDGSKRTRVRYNLEGRFGAAFCFAEVSSDMPSGEFVYILVQDKSNGRVHTVMDNRAALTAARLSAGSKEAQSAMSQLLSGGGSK